MAAHGQQGFSRIVRQAGRFSPLFGRVDRSFESPVPILTVLNVRQTAEPARIPAEVLFRRVFSFSSAVALRLGGNDKSETNRPVGIWRRPGVLYVLPGGDR